MDSTPPRATTPSFGYAGVLFCTGAYTYPNWTAAADLNGDGKPDLDHRRYLQ